MKDFLKMLTANVVGTVLALFVLGMMFFGFVWGAIASLAALGQQPEAAVPDNSVLVIDLTLNITDSPPVATPGDIIEELTEGPSLVNFSLLDLLRAIESAAGDERIKGIFLTGALQSANGGSGYAALAEVRRALEQFKESGKPLIAYAVSPTPRDYFLMSAADTLYLNPFGICDLSGLGTELIYLGDFFKKYGIGIQTTRVGKYKSAVESFTSNKMSEANRQQLSALFEAIWEDLLDGMGSGRGIAAGTLGSLSVERGLLQSQEAREAGLVDKLAYLDEVIARLTEVSAYDPEIESFRQVGVFDYARSLREDRLNGFALDGRPHMAIVYAEGEIVTGEGMLNQVGGQRLARQLRSLRTDTDVRGVVLRINSPGGSVVASEKILREVRLLREEKPVIVSMGHLAASGGYWIASFADEIFAEEMTITGSIGVFGLLLNVKELANNQGITFDGVRTSPFADIGSITRPRSEQEIALIQEIVDGIYEDFLVRVSQGRGLDIGRVKELAQGRVWVGSKAVELGLADKVGGLRAAMERCAEIAGLADGYPVREIPERKDLSEAIQELIERAGDQPVAGQAGPATRLKRRFLEEVRTLDALNDPSHVYARLPYRLSF